MLDGIRVGRNRGATCWGNRRERSRLQALGHPVRRGRGWAFPAVVLASNILGGCSSPSTTGLTWGAYHLPGGVSGGELVNRPHGPERVRRVAWVGFARGGGGLAGAGTGAYRHRLEARPLLSRWLDIAVFDRLRQGSWWRAPWWLRCWPPCWTRPCSGHFARHRRPLVTWALGDLAVKLVLGVAHCCRSGLPWAAWSHAAGCITVLRVLQRSDTFFSPAFSWPNAPAMPIGHALGSPVMPGGPGVDARLRRPGSWAGRRRRGTRAGARTRPR